MAVGSKITAADYNNIQTKVSSTMGLGSGTTGYGQPILSSAVTAGQKFLLSQWTNLRTDMVKARQHQTGVTVGTGSTSNGANLILPTSSLKITEQLRAQYQDMADRISCTAAYASSTDKWAVGSGQYGTETLINRDRYTAWNGTISNTVTITFGGYTSGSLSVSAANHARAFFNAGGNLRITSSRSGSSGTKNAIWTQVLSDSGTIVMGYNSTTKSGGTALSGADSIGSSIGFYQLTTSDQLIYRNNFGTVNSVSVYAENEYYIYARCNVANNTSGGATQVIFTIQFQDNDTGDQQGGYLPGPVVDENVDGTLNTLVEMWRPQGSNVSIPAPGASDTGM